MDRMNRILRLLFGAGLVLTEPRGREKLRDTLSDKIDDLTARGSKGYNDVVDRLGQVSRAVRGEDHSVLVPAVGFLAGIGVGVGLGFLLAPASGAETRGAITDKVHSFHSEVRRATGTD